MIDATKLPTAPCDPAALAAVKQPEPARQAEPQQQYARAPDGDGHAAALRRQGGSR